MANAPLTPLDKALSEFKGFSLPEIATQQTERRPSASAAGTVPADLMPSFEAAAKTHGVPINILLALADQESSFNPRAVGPTTKWGTAKGLMQYLDSTAGNLGINPYDPQQAIDGAARQLRERLDKGLPMDEAVMEHFAGPNRKQWGAKTKQYGIDVMSKAERWAQQYQPSTPVAEGPESVLAEMNKAEPGRYSIPTPEQLAMAQQGVNLAPTASPVAAEQSQDGFLSATGKALQNVPQNFKNAAGGFTRFLGEDMSAEKERSLGMMAQRLGMSLDDAKLVYWAETNGLIDPALKQGDTQTMVQTLREQYANEADPEAAMAQAQAVQQAFERGGIFSPEAVAGAGRQISKEAKDAMIDINPNGPMAKYGSMIIGSTAEMVPALVAGMITRNPNITLGMIGGQVYGQSYERAREAGDDALPPREAAAYALAQAGAEAIPSALPVGIILSQGKNFFTGLLKAGAAEAVQEGITAALQSGIDKGTIDPNMTWEEARQQIVDGIIVGAGSGVAMKAGVDGANKAAYEARGGKLGELGREMSSAVDGAEFATTPAQEAVRALDPNSQQQAAQVQQAQAAPEVTIPINPVVNEEEREKPAGPLARALEKDIPAQIEQNALAGLDASGNSLIEPEGFAGQVGAQFTLDIPGEGPVAVTVQGYAGGDVILATPDGVSLQLTPEDLQSVMPQQQAAPVQEAVPQVAPQAEPVREERTYDQMDEPELRERLKYLAGQAKSSGWNKTLMAERRKVEKAIESKKSETDNARSYDKRRLDRASRISNAESAADIDAVLQEEYSDNERHMDGTGFVEQAARAQRFKVESAERDARNKAQYETGEWAAVAGTGGGSKSAAEQKAAKMQADDQKSEYRAEANNDVWYVEHRKKPADQMAVKDATPVAPELEAQSPAIDPEPIKWFGTQEKADNFIAKKKMAGTHEVVQEGKRFEIREKSAVNPELTTDATVKDSLSVGQAVTLGKGQMKGTVKSVDDQFVKVDFGDRTEKMDLDTFNRRLKSAKAAAPSVAEPQTPKVDRQQAITEAQGAASEVLSQGGTEAEANRAATDLLIDRMADDPSISIAQDAPAAVEAAKQAEPKWWQDSTPAQRYNRMRAAGIKGTAKTAWSRLSAADQRALDQQWGDRSEQKPVATTKVSEGVTATVINPGAGRQQTPAMKWVQSSAEDRRATLNAAGYTDGDQARAYSGAEWADLPSDVREKIEGKPAAEAPRRTAKERAEQVIGKVGDTVVPDQAFDYLTAGKPMVVDNIDRKGNVYLRDPVTGSGTQISTLVAERRGVKFAKQEAQSADAAATDQSATSAENAPAQSDEQGKFTSEQVSKAVERVNDNREAGISTENKGPHYAAGEKASLEGKPRELPSYFTKKTGTNAKAWFAGYDAAKAQAKPAVSENKIFTEDAAAKARAILKSKLTQLNSGIDPEIMQAGITLAGYHIEKGARSFSAYAKAMMGDLGAAVRPYLKSWYMGVKYDPRASDFDGMSSAADVEAFDVSTLNDEATNEPEQLDQRGAGSLEGVSSSPLQGAEGQEQVGRRTAPGSRADARGNERAGSQRDDDARSLGSDAGAVPVSEAGSRGTRRAERDQQPVQRGNERDAARGTDGRRADDLKSASGTTAQQAPANFTIAEPIAQGGAKTKYKANIAAIRLLKQLEAEGRQATRDEQSTLAQYVGWGGIPQAFERSDGGASQGWTKEVAELKELLTAEEYSAAASSTKNAHYTSPQIVSAMWRAVDRLGFKGGRVLEPSVGAGNFFGLMPHELRKASALNGVELDRITSGIAAQLYPEAKVARMGFQDYLIPDGHFDIAIGNPPFGRESLYDGKRKDLSGFSIHNYFFAKSLDGLKPGGVLAMVVTNRMLDVAGDKARRYMADRADFIGAIRLPNDAFMANAGTSVTTDIIFMRKRAEGEAPSGVKWMEVRDYTDKDGNKSPLNEYFHANPQMMLGDFGAYGSMYREGEPALVAREGQDTAAELERAIASLPEGVMQAVTVKPETSATVRAENVRVGSMFLDGNAVKVRGEDVLGENTAEAVTFPNEKAKERVIGMIGLRDDLVRVRTLQLNPNASDKQIANARKALNNGYDKFVAKHGPINLDANKRLFRDDPTWPQLSALEDNFDRGISAAVAKKTGEEPRSPSASKSAIFRTRTQSPYQAPQSASSAKDALVNSLAETGRVDMGMMQRLYGKTEDAIVKELGELIFSDPVKGYVTADEYLSGNVKAKLAQARAASQNDPAMSRNVDALEAVQPADVEPVDINVKPGATWIPKEVMTEFGKTIAESDRGSALYNPGNAKWSFVNLNPSQSASQRFGTGRVTVQAVLEAAANQKTMQVFDSHADGTRTLNETETQLANEKVNAVKEQWGRWIWEDDARRENMARLYNDIFNTDVPRNYDGAHLTLPGKVGDDIVAMRPHQNNAIWRIVQADTTLTDHVVGAGKTYTLIAGAMELRRMGLAKKPMFAVPNHLVGQWAADFLKLYPNANVLAATKKDFQKENRKRLFARIATGDWDAVIVAHSSFGKVEVEPKAQAEFIEEQIADLDASIEMMREADGKNSRNVKDTQKRRDALREKLKKLTDSEAKDDSLYWGELGVDALFVDEAHEFKNLAFSTSMNRVAGLGNQTGSQKAMDMFMKVQQVLKTTGGRNVVFATGTPISNTMAEMYTMQRYLDYSAMKQQGISHFDAWARMYGEVVTDWELSPSGTYKMNSRFAKFVNMPELMQRYTSFADVINRDDINRMLAGQGKKLPVPKVKGGKPNNTIVERSPDQAAYIGIPTTDENGNEEYPRGSLVWRSENLPKKAEKGADNMLKIMGDARKAALDMRLIDPSYPDFAGSKVNQAARDIKALYKQWDADRGVQLVFIDLSTPKNAKAGEAARLRDLVTRAEQGDEAAAAELDKVSPDELMALDSDFSVYDDLKQKLMADGIPEAEIAFIHDAKTELQKEEMFGKVRSGRIRVLLGSTAKMGAGMNVQDRLVALHHLDAPWRPSDLEQREGRIIRQGNKLYERDPEGFEVVINRYATKQTLDSRMWQTIEGKAKFIEQVRKGNGSREVEDVAGEAANSAEMKAASSGNPLILEEMDLRQTVRKLETERSGHDREQHRLKATINGEQRYADWARVTLDELRKDIKRAQPADFAMTIDGATYDKRKDAGEALLAKAAQMEASKTEEADVGSYGDFSIKLERIASERFSMILDGAGTYETHLNIGDDPVGVSMRLTNRVKDLAGLVEEAEQRIAKAKAEIPKLQQQVREWSKDDELTKAKARHSDVIEQLKPKRKEVQTAPEVKASVAEDMERAMAMTEDEYIAAVNPDGKKIDADDRMRLSYGDLETPANARPVETFKDKKGRDVIVLQDADGIMYAQVEGKTAGMMGPYEDGETVIDLVEQAKNSGIGTGLVKAYLRQNPLAPSGGFSPAGEATRRAAFRALKAERSSNTGITVDALQGVLRGGQLGSVLGRMIDNGSLVLHATTPAGINPDFQGWTDRAGKMHLVASKLTQANAMPVLLHEAFHSGGRALLKNERWKNLMARLNGYHKALEAGRMTGEWADAFRRVQNAKAAGDTMSRIRSIEELGAYAVENYERAPSGIKKWVDGIIGAVKEFLYRRFGIQAGQVTPAQLRAMAAAALRSGSTSPRGTPSASRQEQTETEAFKRWFGDSKVVDADGKPLMVYHGTAIPKTSFRRDGGAAGMGAYFTPSLEVANDYAENDAIEDGDTPEVMAVYLSIQNPYTAKGMESHSISAGRRDELEAMGYDGVVSEDGQEIVAFNSEQIKSATGNRGTFDPANPDIRASVPDAPSDTQVEGWFSRKLTDAMSGPKSKGQYSLLALAPMDRMIEEMGKANLPAQEYMKLKRDMDAYRTEKHTEFDATAQKWLKLNLFDRKSAQELAGIMHDATIAQTDPAEPFKSSITKIDNQIMATMPDSESGMAAFAKKAADEQRREAHKKLRAEFLALPAAFQAQYREVRDTYQKMSEELDQIIMDNLAAAIDIHGQKAERVYYKELAEIRDEGLKGAEKEAAEANALRKYNTAMTKQKWNKKARMTQLRQQFESNRLEGPYFPLARFGDYFVTVRDKDTGEVISFSRFERRADQLKFAADVKGMGKVQTGLLSNDTEIKGAVDPRFVSDIETILGGAEVPDSVKDQVWQRYLESMPDMSMRKGFIHRKNREGFSQDALRAFASRMFHGAHQMGRLKFGARMQESLEQAQEVARKTKTPERDMALVNEINRRHDYVMNPKGGAFAQHLTSAAFLYQLSMSPAAALVNISQTIMLGIPIIGAKYGSAKTSAALAVAAKDFTAGRGRADRSKSLNQDERNAMRAAYDAGLIESTNSHNLAGVGETGVEYSAVRNKVMGFMAWMFHQAERFNREVTYLAAYRLAKEKGLSHELAVREAIGLTYKVHFDYGNTNRPRAMHGDTAKVALVFRNYQINMLYRLFRDTHQAFGGETKAERREAIHQLAGITGLMSLSAGVKGVWGYGLAMALASIFFGDDAEEEFKKGTIELLGPTAAAFLLNGVPGHALDINLSSRIGMPDLWFRSPDRQLEGADEFNYWQSQLLGFLPAMAGNMFRGYTQIQDGKVYRGIETASPKFIKDMMRAGRFAQEGVTNMRGDALVSELKPGELIAQMMGFTPAVVTEQYERNSALINAERRIMDARRQLMDRYAVAHKQGDTEETQKIREDIKAFNQENREVRITPDSIRQSLRSRQRYTSRTEGGVTLNPKLDRRLRDNLGDAIYQ